MKKKVSIISLSLLCIGALLLYSNTDIANMGKGADVNVISADYPMYDNAQQLVDASDLVFTGKVTGIKYEALNVMTEKQGDSMTGLTNADPIPYTIFEIKVDTIYKGNIDGDRMMIKRPGGELDGEVYIMKDASEIVKNGQYLFVVETYPDTYASLLNVSQASYDLKAPTSFTTATNEDNSITLQQILELFSKEK